MISSNPYGHQKEWCERVHCVVTALLIAVNWRTMIPILLYPLCAWSLALCVRSILAINRYYDWLQSESRARIAALEDSIRRVEARDL